MTLEDLMLYSFIASLESSEETGINEGVNSKYYEMVNQTVLFAELNKKLNEVIFYGEEGNKLFSRGKCIWNQVMQMPDPIHFEKIIRDTIELLEEIGLCNNYSISKVENTFFWNECLDVIDKKIDMQELNFFRKIAEINILTSCMFEDEININVIDMDCKNANDMQRIYQKKLNNMTDISKDAWIISEVKNGNNTIMYALKYIDSSVIDRYRKFGCLKKCSLNVWTVLDKKDIKIKNSMFNEVFIYCGIGRLTNIYVDDIENIRQKEIIRDFDVSKNKKINYSSANPLQIISDYLGSPDKKFVMSPEKFVELLNMQLINSHCDKMISNHKCLICGDDCGVGRSICQWHIQNIE